VGCDRSGGNGGDGLPGGSGQDGLPGARGGDGGILNLYVPSKAVLSQISFTAEPGDGGKGGRGGNGGPGGPGGQGGSGSTFCSGGINGKSGPTGPPGLDGPAGIKGKQGELQINILSAQSNPAPPRPTPKCSTSIVKEHILTALDVGSETIYVYILNQRFWHRDKYAETYFFPKKPWTDNAITAEQFPRRIKALAQGNFLGMKVHNNESVSLPFTKIQASYSSEMHQVQYYAVVKICIN